MTVLEFMRRQKGLKQKQLAENIGVDPSNLRQLEGGFRRSWPRVRRQLAEALDVDEGLLFDEAGNCKQIDEATIAEVMAILQHKEA